MHKCSDRGSVAVEFALVLPVLVMLIMGIVEFGHAYNAQITLTNAAREGVRVMAITNTLTPAREAAKQAAATLTPALQNTDITFLASDGTSTCSDTKQMTVTIRYTLGTITGIAGPFAMTGKGAMQCGG